MTALALTDCNGLYGVPEFYRACREVGVKPLVGAQMTLADHSITLLAKSSEGYRRLCHLVTAAHKDREKGDPLTTLAMLEGVAHHVICLVASDHNLTAYKELFGGDLYVELTRHREESDRSLSAERMALARRYDLPLVATGAVRYATREEAHLHDVLLCIKHRRVLREAHHIRSGNTHRHLLTPVERGELFAGCPEALVNAERIAARCEVDINFSNYRFPDFPVPEGESTQSYLEKLCYLRRAPCEQLKAELALIDKLGLAGYFLVVWDLVEFAKRRNIPVQGRGSAANSLVAYTLGITPVDPVEHNLYLGRFIHEGMETVPDIDLDFASSRDPGQYDREDVIRYVYERYGEDHVAMVATFITFQHKMAVREVGRVLELPDALLGRLSKLGHVEKSTLQEAEGVADFTWNLFWELVEGIQDIPRHPSVHVGGMLITSCPIADIVPLEPARMEGRVVCQWDKDRVDDAGLIKVDILGLGMLAVLREAVDLMVAPVDLWNLPLDDPKVYERIASGETVGIFQVESRAQMQSLPRTRPNNFQELGVQVAIIRPGPIQGGMVHSYIARKQGKEPVSYLHPSLKPVLEETLGVILFQEQVLQVATVLAGFDAGESEGLRRAMSRKRSQVAMDALWVRFEEGAKAKGVDLTLARQVFSALEGFATYGFCKSHALSFAKITYLSAWLKVYHPAEFTAALLNNQPMGFYAPQTILEDAKRAGVEVLGVDINRSRVRSHVEKGKLRLGLQQIDGMSHEAAQEIEVGRPYRSLRQLQGRTKNLEKLIEAGACDSWGLSRRELLWQLWLLVGDRKQEMPLFERPLAAPALPETTAWEQLIGEHRAMGLSPEAHPIALLRDQWPGIQTSKALKECRDGQRVKVAGLVVCRQKPPTAKGFCFLTLEDEYGFFNIVVRPALYERYRPLIREAPILQIDGLLQSADGVHNVIAQSFYNKVLLDVRASI